MPNKYQAGTVQFIVRMPEETRVKLINLAARRATRDAANNPAGVSEISAQSILRDYIEREIAAEEAKYGPLPTTEPTEKPKRPKKGGRQRKTATGEQE